MGFMKATYKLTTAEVQSDQLANNKINILRFFSYYIELFQNVFDCLKMKKLHKKTAFQF